MRFTTELYQYVLHDETFYPYAECIRYESGTGRLVISESQPLAYVVLHSLTKALLFEPVYLISD